MNKKNKLIKFISKNYNKEKLEDIAKYGSEKYGERDLIYPEDAAKFYKKFKNEIFLIFKHYGVKTTSEFENSKNINEFEQKSAWLGIDFAVSFLIYEN